MGNNQNECNQCYFNWLVNPLTFVMNWDWNWLTGSFTNSQDPFNAQDTKVILKLVYGSACQTKVADFMTIYKISIGRMAPMFWFYFNFNFSVLANIW